MKPLLLMRKRGLFGTIAGKFANLTNKLAKSAGHKVEKNNESV